MGPATSKTCCLPHDFSLSRQFLAGPSLPRDAFCLLLSVCPSGCQAAKSSRWARGSSQRYCTERRTTGAGDAPGEDGRKMGIYHSLGSKAQGINIFHPTSLPAGRRMLRDLIRSVLRMSDS